MVPNATVSCRKHNLLGPGCTFNDVVSLQCPATCYLLLLCETLLSEIDKVARALFKELVAGPSCLASSIQEPKKHMNINY
eukprot:165260-Amphidinium_carterae.1